MAHNPFRYLQPVSPEDFIGRWSLVKSIAQDVTRENGDSHAVIAGQRCGKTSMLNALAHQLCQPTTLESGDSVALPIYIDFKAGTFDSEEAVFAFILNQIYRQINTTVRQHALMLGSTALRLGARWFEKLINTPNLPQSELEDGLGYVLDQLASPTAPVRLVLLLDDIGKSFNQPWTDALYSQSRALICSSDLQTRLRLVLTGSQHFLEQRSMYSASLCNVLKLHYLETFDRVAISQLIARVASWPLEIADAVWQQSGGHPFLAQYLLYHLWEHTEGAGISQAKAGMIDQLAAGFPHKRVFELEGWAQTVGLYGLATYKVLSDTTDWVAEDQLIAAVDASAQHTKLSLLGLCCHGLAIHNEDWTHYKYTGALFRNWFSDYTAASLTALEHAMQKSAAPQTNGQVYININTGGGPYIAGGVNTGGGEFIGHDENA